MGTARSAAAYVRATPWSFSACGTAHARDVDVCTDCVRVLCDSFPDSYHTVQRVRCCRSRLPAVTLGAHIGLALRPRLRKLRLRVPQALLAPVDPAARNVPRSRSSMGGLRAASEWRSRGRSHGLLGLAMTHEASAGQGWHARQVETPVCPRHVCMHSRTRHGRQRGVHLFQLSRPPRTPHMLIRGGLAIPDRPRLMLIRAARRISRLRSTHGTRITQSSSVKTYTQTRDTSTRAQELNS